MKSGWMAALAAGAVLAAGAASAAVELHFTIVTNAPFESYFQTLSWDQSSEPGGLSSSPETTVPITNFEVNGVAVSSVTSATFFDAPSFDGYGGVLFPAYDVTDNGFNFFTGTLTDPIFLYPVVNQSLNNSTLGVTNDLANVSVIGTPEPAAWALMLAGVAGIGAMVRFRRTRMAVAQT